MAVGPVSQAPPTRFSVLPGWLRLLLARAMAERQMPTGEVSSRVVLPGGRMTVPPSPAPQATPWQGPPGAVGPEGAVPAGRDWSGAPEYMPGGRPILSRGAVSGSPSMAPPTQTPLAQNPSSLADWIIATLGSREFRSPGIPPKPEEGPGVR